MMTANESEVRVCHSFLLVKIVYSKIINYEDEAKSEWLTTLKCKRVGLLRIVFVYNYY